MVDSALPTALWLTYTLYLGLLCGFGLWWLLPELWEHLTPVSAPMDVARHVNLRVRLIFVGPDDETLAILAPLALRRAAVARLRLALRDDEPGGVVRWQVSASKKLGGLPPVGNEEALQQPETRAALRFHVLLQPLHARRGSCRCGMATLADDARLGWVRVEAGSSDGVVACVSNASGALDALARTLRTELGSRSRMLAQTDPAHVLRPMGRVSMSLLQPGAAPTAERRHERSVRLDRLRRRAQRLLSRAFPRGAPQLHSQMRYYATLDPPPRLEARHAPAFVLTEEGVSAALTCGGTGSGSGGSGGGGCATATPTVMPEPPTTLLLYAADPPHAPLRLMGRDGALLPRGDGFVLPAATGAGGAAGGGFALWSEGGGGGGGGGGNMQAVTAQLRVLLGLPTVAVPPTAAAALPPSPSACSAASPSAAASPSPPPRVHGVTWLEAAALQVGCALSELGAAADEAAAASQLLGDRPAAARRAVWPLLREASARSEAATRLLRGGEWAAACAEAATARAVARAASRHPELVPLQPPGLVEAVSVYAPLFFPLATSVCGGVAHEVRRYRALR